MSEKASALARFGIKVRLQAAFGAVAITTVIAAVVAIMSFSETERGFQRVSTREVPMMTDALRLSVASAAIVMLRLSIAFLKPERPARPNASS